tara:strand:- start:25582 stop:25911 length:330 start_codon:yes stop_codon:yes gene_type:complete
MIYVLIFTVVVTTFFIQKKQNDYRDKKAGWKVFKKESHIYIYSERINNKWEKIEIERVYEFGSFFPKFKNSDEWKTYPIWAQKRYLIIKRVLERFPYKKVNEIDGIGKN